MSTARQFHTASVVKNGKVLVTGGFRDDFNTKLNSSELYESSSAVWSIADTMNIGRAGHIASVFSNGNILVTGGYGE